MGTGIVATSRLSTYMAGKVTPSAAMLIRIERMAARLAEASDMGPAQRPTDSEALSSSV